MAETQIEMFPAATTARDAALKQARENSGDWFLQALATFDRHRPAHQGCTMTGEDVRALVEAHLGPPPNHVNAYGALVRAMARRKWIEDTGDRCNATTINSHAREIRIWRIL